MGPLGNRTYLILFSLLGIVSFIGLFIPLMDNDAAHHANIALHMHLTDNYVDLIDNGADYLDKPHLHFWLAALSYKVFGVTAFAYKFPSFLLSIVGVYSVYRMGSLLYNEETGKLSALLFAGSFAFLLALNDVRMDAILVAAIAFSCWQMLELLEKDRAINILGASLGLAIGFSVKGMAGVIVPALFIIFYLVNKKNWRILLSVKLLLTVLLFLIFITPVLYCYYLQFDLHPEKLIRGRDHISGIRFILLGQGTERFGGGMSRDAGGDYFFFLYSFLWAFAPWSVFTYLAIADQLRKKQRWFLSATIIAIALLISFAGSKLPHYLNICFPFVALITANYLQNNLHRKFIRITLYIITAIVIIATLLVNEWLFPSGNTIASLLFIFLLFIPPSIITRNSSMLSRPLLYAASAMIYLFLLLNTNFYPGLLTYQGGQELAVITKNKVDPEMVYFWKNNYSSSYCFTTKTLRKEFTDSIAMNRNARLIYDIAFEKEILGAGYSLTEKIMVKDFEITKLDKAFANPKTREAHCSELVMAVIRRTIAK